MSLLAGLGARGRTTAIYLATIATRFPDRMPDLCREIDMVIDRHVVDLCVVRRAHLVPAVPEPVRDLRLVASGRATPSRQAERRRRGFVVVATAPAPARSASR